MMEVVRSQGERGEVAGGASYPVRAGAAVEPNETATMPCKVQRSARIIDLIGLPPNVVVTRASLGRVRFSREESGLSLGEFLRQEPYTAKAGSFLAFEVVNLGAMAREIVAEMLVEDEEGEVAAANPPPSSAARRGSGEDAAAHKNDVVEAIIDAALSGGTIAAPAPARTGTRPAATPEPAGSRSAAASRSATAKAKDRAKAAKAKDKAKDGTSGKSSVRVPRVPTAGMPKPLRPQRVMTLHARKKMYGLVDAAVVPSATAVPGADERVTVLHRGYADMLHLFLTAGAPLSRDARIGLSIPLREAFERGDAPAAIEVGECALRLSVAEHERVMNAIDNHGEHELLLDEVLAMKLQTAIDGEPAPIAAEPQTNGDAAAIVPTGPLASVVPIGGRLSPDDGRSE